MPKKPKINHVDSEEPRKDTVKWSEQMDIVLIDALLEQQVNGNRVDGTFTTTAYNNVLKGLSGFAWNPNNKLFEAEPEVWNSLIEAKPNAKKWRHTPVYHYDKLSELFAKDRANGEGAVTTKEKVQLWEREGSPNHVVDVEHLDEVNNICSESFSPQYNSQPAIASKGIKRKASMLESLDKYLENVQSGMNNVADAIREGNKIIERGQPHRHLEQEVYDELINIGVPEELQLDAYLFLIDSESKKRAFFAVPSERRYELLLKLMYPTNRS
ncbi:hypothetical protein Q3G72_030491 [Acer saccharum]|nr:hypothetical protein Q3G72_030491 [Acer saccharum]